MWRRWVALLALVGAALLLAAPAAPAPAASGARPLVVRIAAPTEDAARRLAGLGLDLLEQRDGADLFALVTPDEARALAAAGWDVRPDAAQSELLGRPGPAAFQGGYRTVEEIYALMGEAAASRPELATLVDFGDSWEKLAPGGAPGYDLLALRLTGQAPAGPRPVFMLVAAVHARELVTSEIAARMISLLLEGYGRDPDLTMLLDEHEVVVVPVANPDGRKLAEQGYYQRKNTNPLGGPCPTPPRSGSQYGVDLNRNFSHSWGTVDMPTFSPCALTYPGPQAASEPETQALQTLMRELFGPAPGPAPATGAPAAADRPGVMISLHSYSNLILWPWGATSQPAPNAEGLRRLGERMAGFNGYAPMAAVELYPASGTTDDWLYAELGVASFTFEVGPSAGGCAGFMPPFSCLDQAGGLWAGNRNALLYGLRVARAPYTLPAGPDVREVRVARQGPTLTVTATVDGRGGPVLGAELYLGGQGPGGPGSVPLVALDGAFGGASEQVAAAIDVGGGAPYLVLRGRGEVWGPPYGAGVSEATPLSPRLWLPLVAGGG